MVISEQEGNLYERLGKEIYQRKKDSGLLDQLSPQAIFAINNIIKGGLAEHGHGIDKVQHDEFLVREGIRTAQKLGVPSEDLKDVIRFSLDARRQMVEKFEHEPFSAELLKETEILLKGE